MLEAPLTQSSKRNRSLFLTVWHNNDKGTMGKKFDREKERKERLFYSLLAMAFVCEGENGRNHF